MKYIKQILILLLFCLAGELLSLLPLPIPAAVYGLVLMLIALWTGIVKPEAIADTARLLISIMPLLFVAPAVNILSYWGIIASNLVPIVVIVLVSTFVVFSVSGLVAKLFLRKEENENG